MKLKAIRLIKGYKSFQDFSWQPFFNNTEFHDDVNILYGENGSGKSAVCNILKNLSQNKELASQHKPKEVRLSFDDGEYQYQAGANKWDRSKDREDILFFDREFVDENVHLGHERGTHQDQQEQKSGRMIIEFDSKAIKLREALQSAKVARDEQEENLQNFKTANKVVLKFPLSDTELGLFQKYKDWSKDEIEEAKNALGEEIKSLEKELATDRRLQQNFADIQSIEEIALEASDVSLSDYERYQAVFDFDLKEGTKPEAEQTLTDKLRRHKDFFEKGFEIRAEHAGQCPFCQSSNEEENIAKIREAYNAIFGDVYEERCQQFAKDKQALIEELETIKQRIEKLDLDRVFMKIGDLKQKYHIENIYSPDERRNYGIPSTINIGELIVKISNLQKPSKENMQSVYDGVKEEFERSKRFLASIEVLVGEKNVIIRQFKADNTKTELEERIRKNNTNLNEIKQQLTFLNGNKIEPQKRKESAETELGNLEKRVDDAHEAHRKAKETYEGYCSKEVFTRPLKTIERYFKNFNFSFKLELKTERLGNKLESPFAFKVLDFEGNERDFKEGLSEGELQVLSLCFFFAFLDVQGDRKNKILVFDDPVTSLDNSNLSALVDLIADERKNVSQTFVFTHHRAFFKLLRKRFRTGTDNKKPGCHEYNIIRNRKDLGGSFICQSEATRFTLKLKRFESKIYEEAKQGKKIDAESKIIEYGQYLRYEVERFIKNDLLFWHADGNFSVAISGIKKNQQKIEEQDLDRIQVIYQFCNWTTSHVDVGDDHGLKQLKDKIKDFIEIVERLDSRP